MSTSGTVEIGADGMEHTTLTLDEFIGDVVILGDQIEDHTRLTGQQYDAMVVPPRGGYLVADVLARRFDFEAPEMLHACLTSYLYGESSGKFSNGQWFTQEQVEGKDLLAVDEVADSLKTWKRIRDSALNLGARSISLAVSDWKPENNETDLIPDFFVNKRGPGWIHYPGDWNEVVGLYSRVKKRTPEQMQRVLVARAKLPAEVQAKFVDL